MFKTGEIVTINYQKIRPCLIIKESISDYLVLFLSENTKNYNPDDTCLIIDNANLENGFIERNYIVQTLQSCLVSKELIVDKLAKVNKNSMEKIIKNQVFLYTNIYYDHVHKNIDNQFIDGITRTNYAGRVFDNNELLNLVDASLEFWLTYGKFSKMFEKQLSKFLNVKHVFSVNSGSSANLLSFMALTSDLLENRKIKRGDEVITVAAGFPTTVAPIIQYGAVPVFVDIEIKSCNIDTNQLDQALSEKTKAVFLAHTLGNPFDLYTVKEFCDKHNLWLIEDNCDALGSKYDGKYTGTFGDIGTSSFYPPHHITMGEGGAVYTNNSKLKQIILSMRDWGRDCWCESGHDNTCNKRFSGQYGKLPFGYDHKYVYSHFGFNFKITDLQAAIGCEQLNKLPGFIKKRFENHSFLVNGLKDLNNIFILPQQTPLSKPSWFGFLLTIRDNSVFNRNEIVEYLEAKNIQTRNLFAGNIIRQPCFNNLISEIDYRVIGNLENTDKIMNDSFWIGVYPGMRKEQLEFMIKSIWNFIREKK